MFVFLKAFLTFFVNVHVSCENLTTLDSSLLMSTVFYRQYFLPASYFLYQLHSRLAITSEVFETLPSMMNHGNGAFCKYS